MKTTREVAELLQVSNQTIISRARAIGKAIEVGKYTYYSDEEIERIKQYSSTPDTATYESIKPYGSGQRYFISAFNQVLGKRVSIPRYHYNYLVASGDWSTGITTIPKGYVIHHKDNNPFNDELDNIELITISEHRKIHDAESSARRDKVRLIMHEKGFKKIAVIDETGTQYESLMDASRKLGVHQNTIRERIQRGIYSVAEVA